MTHSTKRAKTLPSARPSPPDVRVVGPDHAEVPIEHPSPNTLALTPRQVSLSTMSYDEQRQALESEIRSTVNADQARVIAYAHLPWLDRGRATYGFFEAMTAERDSFVELSSRDVGGPDGIVRAATVAVERYSALARQFGARDYEAVAAEVLGGTAPAIADPGSSAPTNGSVPSAVSLVVGATTLRLEAIASKKGNAWYTLLSESGSALRGGVAVPPDGPGLPDQVRLGDVDLDLGPAPLWDDETRQYSDIDHEPFDVKRLVERDVVLGEHAFRVRVLVSARRDGAWNVTAKLWPQETVPFSELMEPRGPAPRSRGRASAGTPSSQSDTGAADVKSRNLDLLLETLKDATG